MHNAVPHDNPARPVIRLLKGRSGRVRAGSPWAYANEIDMTADARALPPGSLVTIMDPTGQPVGPALFNPRTLIAVRLLGRDAGAAVDRSFFAARIARALALRERLFDEPYYRLIHAEADGIPGVVIDRYGENVVLEINTAGMDRLKDPLLGAVADVLSPAAVVLRGEGPARRLEGLDDEAAVVQGALDGPVTVVEGGARFLADPVAGQKTGWFFDQRENRARVARLAAGASMLDLYCYLGGFAISAALAGARAVTAIDRSQPALDLAQQSAVLNGVADRVTFERTNAFEAMERMAAGGLRFDIVVADPPAFVKSRKDLAAGLRGYRKMVRLAARLVAPEGILFAASCSHLVEPAAFATEAARALHDAGRVGRILAPGGAGPDHPVHPNLPETAYLKSLLIALD